MALQPRLGWLQVDSSKLMKVDNKLWWPHWQVLQGHLIEIWGRNLVKSKESDPEAWIQVEYTQNGHLVSVGWTTKPSSVLIVFWIQVRISMTLTLRCHTYKKAKPLNYCYTLNMASTLDVSLLTKQYSIYWKMMARMPTIYSVLNPTRSRNS